MKPRLLSEAWRLASIAGFAWAQREIRPDHPDVPLIVQRLAQLRTAAPAVRFSVLCCRRADCPDFDCPGRGVPPPELLEADRLVGRFPRVAVGCAGALATVLLSLVLSACGLPVVPIL